LTAGGEVPQALRHRGASARRIAGPVRGAPTGSAPAGRKSESTQSVQGGTFTVTNLGSFGIDTFSPIINPPQAAILAIGRIAPRAVERQGTLSLAPTVFLTLAVDHRVLDGAQAAAFLRDLKAQIEHAQI
jgi:pyruvate dehydrogenase E2 component (dihydrolipoamide acetyltransferase)